MTIALLQHFEMQSFYFLCSLWFIFASPDTSPLIWDICGFNNDHGSWYEDLELAKERAFGWIHEQRNEQWGWNQTPAVVLAMQLGNQNWALCEDNLEAQLSLQRMDIEMLTYLSHGNASTLSPGLLASYISALISTCRDPSDFYGHDLKKMLKFKMQNFPLSDFSNHYQYSLGVLALCGSQTEIEPQFVTELLEAQRKDRSFDHSIDVTAMSTMALTCVLQQGNLTASGAVNKSISYLVSRQKADGSFGNIHSTVLATQALIAAGVDFNLWNCEEAFQSILTSQLADGSFGSVLLATTQTIPLLSGRSLINNECPLNYNSSDTVLETTILKSNDENQPASIISVSMQIDNGWDYELSVDLELPVHSTLYQMLEIASQKFGALFSFEAKNSAYGRYIHTINGIRANNIDRTYWKIYKGKEALETGVDTLVLQNGDEITFKYSKW